MRTARSLPYAGDLLTETPLGQRPPPWTETPLPPERSPMDKDPPIGDSLDRHPLDRDPPRQRPPPPGHVSCGACWDRHPPPWTEWHTGVKELPCRNFVAGGNKNEHSKGVYQRINAIGHTTLHVLTKLPTVTIQNGSNFGPFWNVLTRSNCHACNSNTCKGFHSFLL